MIIGVAKHFKIIVTGETRYDQLPFLPLPPIFNGGTFARATIMPPVSLIGQIV